MNAHLKEEGCVCVGGLQLEGICSIVVGRRGSRRLAGHIVSMVKKQSVTMLMISSLFIWASVVPKF